MNESHITDSSDMAAVPAPGGPAGPGALEVAGIRKRFGTVQANDGVTARFPFGHVHALLGENGAGKSTLIKILAGIYHPDEGRISVAGEDVSIGSTEESVAQGIAVVHQHSSLIGRLTVLENVALVFSGLGRIDPALRGRIEATAASLGFHLDPGAKVEDLTVGDRQRVEIVRALMGNARMIFLDEPTAVLAPNERGDLFALLRRLADADAAIVLVTHRLEEAIRHCDGVTILRGGRTVSAIDDPSGMTEADLVRLMVGDVRLETTREPVAPGEVVLALTGIRGQAPGSHWTTDVPSLEVRAGEVLAVAGVEGNGQSGLAGLLSGAWTPEEGSIALKGRPLHDIPARERTALIGHVPDDERLGFSTDLRVWENLAAERMIYELAPSLRNRRRMRADAARLVEEFNVRTPSVEALGGQLSGGNRRRVQIARELAKRPELLVACYASKGLDVRSIQQLKNWCRDLALQGSAVVYIASDLEEILDVADRVVVLSRGILSESMPVAEATADRIGHLMLVGAREEVVS